MRPYNFKITMKNNFISSLLKFVFEIRNVGFRKRVTFFGMHFYFSAIPLSRQIFLQARLANQVASVHKKTFEPYRGIYANKEIVIVATGQSLQKYTPIKDAIHIGVNGAIEQKKVALDYLFVQDFTGKNSQRAAAFIEYNKETCTKFFGIVAHFEKSNIPEFVVRDAAAKTYLASEEGFFTDLTKFELPALGSVSFAALAFALWTHPKRIYLVGCDCTSGYFNLPDNSMRLKFSESPWLKAKKFADIHYPDCEIVSINPVGLKGIFKDVYM